MKTFLLFFLYSLITEGVFGESVSVKEGGSVTLHTGLTEINDEIEWWFGAELDRIARMKKDPTIYEDALNGTFRGRLQLDGQTGDLTITNIKTTDAGDYKVSNSIKTLEKFSVTVVPVDDVKSVSVLVRDSVTLQTGLTNIQRDAVIKWRFEQQESPVAKISRREGIFNTFDGPDGRFRDRLKLDHQTGSLIITDTRTTDSGLYEVEIIRTSSRHTIHHTQSFNVTVRDAVKSVSVTKGGTVTLQTNVIEIQKDDLILWMFGDIVIAEISKSVQQFYNGPDGRFRDRLKLDNQTGSLTITNTRTTDAGLYELKISGSRHNINRRFIVTVTEPVLYPATIALIVGGGVVVGVLLLVAAAAAVVVMYRCNKISQPKMSWKMLSVIEGESVPLIPSDTEISKDNLRWLFNKSPLAEIKRKPPAPFNVLHENFKGRLDWPGNLGPLNIENIQITDFGLYELQIIRSENNIQTLELFSVMVYARTDDIKIKEVKEGGSVTLESGVTGIQKDDEVLWKFALENTPIAAIQGGWKKTPPFGSGWRFRGRLELDENGSLTISNVGRLDTGFYALHITRSGNASLHLFRVKISNSEVIYIKEHTPSEDNGEVESLYKKMDECRKNESPPSELYVNMEELSETQQCKSAGSDPESNPFLKTEGNEEHGYEIL